MAVRHPQVLFQVLSQVPCDLCLEAVSLTLEAAENSPIGDLTVMAATWRGRTTVAVRHTQVLKPFHRSVSESPARIRSHGNQACWARSGLPQQHIAECKPLTAVRPPLASFTAPLSVPISVQHPGLRQLHIVLWGHDLGAVASKLRDPSGMRATQATRSMTRVLCSICLFNSTPSGCQGSRPCSEPQHPAHLQHAVCSCLHIALETSHEDHLPTPPSITCMSLCLMTALRALTSRS